jgi:hypothetical protein
MQSFFDSLFPVHRNERQKGSQIETSYRPIRLSQFLNDSEEGFIFLAEKEQIQAKALLLGLKARI